VTWYTVTAGPQPVVSSPPLTVCCCLPQYQSSYTYFTGVKLRSFRRPWPNRAPCSLGAHCPSPKRNCEWFYKRTAAAVYYYYNIIIICGPRASSWRAIQVSLLHRDGTQPSNNNNNNNNNMVVVGRYHNSYTRKRRKLNGSKNDCSRMFFFFRTGTKRGNGGICSSTIICFIYILLCFVCSLLAHNTRPKTRRVCGSPVSTSRCSHNFFSAPAPRPYPPDCKRPFLFFIIRKTI